MSADAFMRDIFNSLN